MNKNQFEHKTADSLWAEIYRLRAALAEIRDYDKNSKFGDGICPYGCDCPSIAGLALKNKVKLKPSNAQRHRPISGHFGN